MATYIALLRGINVGGRKKIEMPELITAFESLGFEDVKTYLQSGNVIFITSKRDRSELISLIQEKIKWAFNYPVSVVLRTANELQGIIATNPFLKDSKIDTNKLHVTFLSDKPTVSTLNQIKEMQDEKDEFVISGQEVYLHCPKGYGRTKFSNTYFEKKLGVATTTRNWKTVTQLFDIGKDRTH
ncbi:DUF1697 domain-containing protein [Chloroflexota bacterium]